MAIKCWAKDVVNRCGLGPREREPAILFLGSSLAAFVAIAPIVERLLHRDQRLSVYLCTADQNIRQYLAARFDAAHVVPPPFGVAATLFLSRYKVRALVVLENAALLTAALAKNAAHRATPFALMSGRGLEFVCEEKDAVLKPEFMIVGEPISRSSECLDERLHLIPIKENGFDEAQADDVVAALKPLIGRDRKWSARRDQKIGRWIAKMLFSLIENPFWARRMGSRIERIDDLEMLSKQLGFPKTILCLGNGPSSEDPRLCDVDYDALFRANHAWAARGFLTQPDVVFTGVKASMRKVKGAIFGVLDENTEKVLLMTRGLRALVSGRLRYFVVDKIKGFPHGMDWKQHRPTSGAIMLSAAVQLRPERLVIAGIDMFQHPAGSYPGDTATVNAYAPAHTYDKELNFILHCLDGFEGDIIIIGDVLAREWEQFRQSKTES